MKLFDENYAEITEDKADLTSGFIREENILKHDAIPIDNVNKFAWEDGDWETVRVYVKFKPESAEPSPIERLEAQIAYIAMVQDICLEV